MNKRIKLRKLLLQAIKAAIGSSAAIYIAESLNLQFAASAGSIAFLTVITTKWETLKLSLFRMITFVISIILIGGIMFFTDNDWGTYGVFLFLIVIICELLGWLSTVSVNAVIGTHFLTMMEFNKQIIWNEFLLVLIGISVSIFLNLFHANDSQKKDLIRNMRFTENHLQKILENLAIYLLNKTTKPDVWDSIDYLENQIQIFTEEAHEYQSNTFHSHPEYYIDYFEMRMSQCNVLYSLHYEMEKIREIPREASIVAEYILYMANYVTELNVPVIQIKRLKEIFQVMREEPLPISREEFENRAILYHILMDLEDFLLFKKRFVEELNEVKLKRYWKREKGEQPPL